MADRHGEIGWYLPEQRAVFLPGEAHVSGSLGRLIRRDRFRVLVDRDFRAVVHACAGREETWISSEIVDVYSTLHEHGLAHSVEVYDGETLVGGLYGVALGGVFFGESMFHHATDASKVAFASLCRRLDERGYRLHDAQFMTPHLASLGAREISRTAYLRILEASLPLRCRFV